MWKKESCGSTTKGRLIGKLKIVPEYWNVTEHKTFTQQKRFSFVLCKVISSGPGKYHSRSRAPKRQADWLMRRQRKIVAENIRISEKFTGNFFVYFKGIWYPWKSLLEKRRDKVPTGVRSLLLLNRCKTTPKRGLGLDISTVLWGMPPLFGNYCCKAVPSDQALQMTSMCCPPMVCSSNHTTCIRKGLS